MLPCLGKILSLQDTANALIKYFNRAKPAPMKNLRLFVPAVIFFGLCIFSEARAGRFKPKCNDLLKLQNIAFINHKFEDAPRALLASQLLSPGQSIEVVAEIKVAPNEAEIQKLKSKLVADGFLLNPEEFSSYLIPNDPNALTTVRISIKGTLEQIKKLHDSIEVESLFVSKIQGDSSVDMATIFNEPGINPALSSMSDAALTKMIQKNYPDTGLYPNPIEAIESMRDLGVASATVGIFRAQYEFLQKWLKANGMDATIVLNTEDYHHFTNPGAPYKPSPLAELEVNFSGPIRKLYEVLTTIRPVAIHQRLMSLEGFNNALRLKHLYPNASITASDTVGNVDSSLVKALLNKKTSSQLAFTASFSVSDGDNTVDDFIKQTEQLASQGYSIKILGKGIRKAGLGTMPPSFADYTELEMQGDLKALIAATRISHWVYFSPITFGTHVGQFRAFARSFFKK